MSDLVRTSRGSLSYLTDIIGIQARNMDALHQAGQALLDGMSALARHQADTIEAVLARSTSAKLPPLIAGPGIAAAIGDRIDALKTGITETQARSNILTELATRSAGEVSGILQARFMAALDEVKAAVQHAIPEQPTVAPAPMAPPVAARAKASMPVAALTPDPAPARASAA